MVATTNRASAASTGVRYTARWRLPWPRACSRCCHAGGGERRVDAEHERDLPEDARRTGREASWIRFIGVENVDATACRIEHLAEFEVERPAHYVGLPV